MKNSISDRAYRYNLNKLKEYGDTIDDDMLHRLALAMSSIVLDRGIDILITGKVALSYAESYSLILSGFYERMVNRDLEELNDKQIMAQVAYTVKDIIKSYNRDTKKRKSVPLENALEVPETHLNAEESLIKAIDIDEHIENATKVLTKSQKELIKGVLSLGKEGYLKSVVMSESDFNQRVARIIKKLNKL